MTTQEIISDLKWALFHENTKKVLNTLSVLRIGVHKFDNNLILIKL